MTPRLALVGLLSLSCVAILRDTDPGATDRDGGGVDASRGDARVEPSQDGGDADGGSVPDGTTEPPPPRDAGLPPRIDAGPCGGPELLSGFSVTDVAGVSGGSQLFADATPDGGVVVGWNAGGAITLRRLGGDGSLVGEAISIDGNGLWGVAATPNVLAALVSRGSDALYVAGTSYAGEPRFATRALGEVDHGVTENEWFGTGIRYGRLTWTGTELAAYYTVNRLWADGIAHYGDQLRNYGEDGVERSMRWSWGCSHSMEVRVVHNGTRLGPVCSSDCFPSKGVHFDHRGGELYTDETGSNCAGRYGTTLGGVVPMDDGFWVTFTATDDRASHDVALIHVANGGARGPLRWLTEDATHDRHVKAARYGAGFVVAWESDGQARFERFDASGASIEGPVAVPGAGLASASDFFVYGDGDVGWVTRGAAGLQLARLRVCE